MTEFFTLYRDSGFQLSSFSKTYKKDIAKGILIDSNTFMQGAENDRVKIVHCSSIVGGRGGFIIAFVMGVLSHKICSVSVN